MAITLLQAQDLVGLLHAGTVGPRLWADFLQALKLRTGANEAMLLLLGEGAHSRIMVQRAGQEPQVVDGPLWLQLSATRGGAGATGLRPRRVYSDRELREAASGAQIATLAHFAEETESSHTRVMWLDDAVGNALWVLLGRRGEDFTTSDSVLLAELGEHLRTALSTWGQFDRAKMAAQAGTAALARQGFAWLRLDLAGQVVDRSASVEQANGGHDPYRVTAAGRFLPREAQDQPAFAAYLASAAAASLGEPLPEGLMLGAGRMLILAQSNPDGSGVSIMVYVQSTWPRSDVRTAILEKTYALSHKEAKLAVLLCEGVTLAEAAGKLDLTLESTRLYSKRLFAKTGTAGQVDLVRSLLSGPVALA